MAPISAATPSATRPPSTAAELWLCTPRNAIAIGVTAAATPSRMATQRPKGLSLTTLISGGEINITTVPSVRRGRS
jgi:hypothetical protein